MRSIPHQPQRRTRTDRGNPWGMCAPVPAAGQGDKHGLAASSGQFRPLPGRGPSQSLDVSSLDRLGRALIRRPALFSFLATPETYNSLLAGGRSRMDGCALGRQTGLGTVAIIVVPRQSILPATYRAAGVIFSTGKRGLTARHTISGTCSPISFQTRDQFDCQVTYRSPRPVHPSRSPSGPVADTSNLTRGEKHDVPRNRAFGT